MHLGAVDKTFADALIWHMNREQTGVTELADATGVSRVIIKKLRMKKAASTAAENAVAISKFYGKTVSQFLQCDEQAIEDKLTHLIGLLTREERKQLERQVQGLLVTRGTTPDR